MLFHKSVNTCFSSNVTKFSIKFLCSRRGGRVDNLMGVTKRGEYCICELLNEVPTLYVQYIRFCNWFASTSRVLTIITILYYEFVLFCQFTCCCGYFSGFNNTTINYYCYRSSLKYTCSFLHFVTSST